MNPRGLDIGTAFLVSAVEDKSKISISSVRDCFISLDQEQAPMLEMSGVDFVEGTKNLYVVGSDAVELSAATGNELRRPLSRGFISSKEEDGKAVVSLILKQILGKGDGDIVVYSVPGAEYNSKASTDLQFHTRFFKELIEELGYKAKPINEAVAVAFSETMQGNDQELPLTAISISFGAGMTNIAITYKSIPVRTFSIAMGGDFIDEGAATATDTPVSHVTMLKEHGVDVFSGTIVNPLDSHDHQSERQAEAISIMYKDLLTTLVNATNEFINSPSNRVEINDTLPIIYSGGTSLIPGFDKLFNDIFVKNLDTRFKIGSVRQAQYPLDATARGALNYARLLANRK